MHLWNRCVFSWLTLEYPGYRLCWFYWLPPNGARLLANGHAVVGLDNLNSYYDPALKQARLQRLRDAALKRGAEFKFVRADLEDRSAVEQLFATFQPHRVVNLAAQAGVRYSIENPAAYI